MRPQNFEEKVVWYCITGTYALYLLGAQFIVIPIMAWVLLLYFAIKLWYQSDNTPVEERINIPYGVWIWIGSMLLIELALVMGHLDFNLGILRIVKTTINFFLRTWALLALFPLIGCLNIRAKLISRAVCILGLQTLIAISICYLAYALHLPSKIYTSPLQKIGGLSDVFYTVRLYVSDSESSIRLYLFAPWAPALGLVGNIYFYLACYESNKKWKWIGIIASVAMVICSVSRAAIVCLLCMPLLTLFLVNSSKPSVQVATGLGSFFTGIFAPQLLHWLKDFSKYFRNQRADSSEVRDILGRIAIRRWWTEAPIWGIGLPESRGPELTAFMPIGTHHTWFGLLFNHGIVGFVALLVAMVCSLIELLIKAQKSLVAWVSLGILLVLLVFTFVDPIEGLAYIYWPGLVVMGIAFKAETSRETQQYKISTSQ